MPDGSRITTLIDQLDAALREAGLQRNSFGEKYSIYSLRHFYAVNALRNGIGVFEVARNMGTSTAEARASRANHARYAAPVDLAAVVSHSASAWVAPTAVINAAMDKVLAVFMTRNFFLA